MTGIAQPDAERRVEDAITAATTALHKARRSAVILGFTTAASLLAGAAAAWYAASAGGRHRDNVAASPTWWWPQRVHSATSTADVSLTPTRRIEAGLVSDSAGPSPRGERRREFPPTRRRSFRGMLGRSPGRAGRVAAGADANYFPVRSTTRTRLARPQIKSSASGRL